MENKTIKLDPSTLKKLEAVKRKLNEEQYGTDIENTLTYCIQHTHRDLLL